MVLHDNARLDCCVLLQKPWKWKGFRQGRRQESILSSFANEFIASPTKCKQEWNEVKQCLKICTGYICIPTLFAEHWTQYNNAYYYINPFSSSSKKSEKKTSSFASSQGKLFLTLEHFSRTCLLETLSPSFCSVLVWHLFVCIESLYYCLLFTIVCCSPYPFLFRLKKWDLSEMRWWPDRKKILKYLYREHV